MNVEARWVWFKKKPSIGSKKVQSSAERSRNVKGGERGAEEVEKANKTHKPEILEKEGKCERLLECECIEE